MQNQRKLAAIEERTGNRTEMRVGDSGAVVWCGYASVIWHAYTRLAIAYYRCTLRLQICIAARNSLQLHCVITACNYSLAWPLTWRHEACVISKVNVIWRLHVYVVHYYTWCKDISAGLESNMYCQHVFMRHIHGLIYMRYIHDRIHDKNDTYSGNIYMPWL